jgi:hypothetical protein
LAFGIIPRPWEAHGDEAESQRITSLHDFDGGSQATYARMVKQMDLQVARSVNRQPAFIERRAAGRHGRVLVRRGSQREYGADGQTGR